MDPADDGDPRDRALTWQVVAREPQHDYVIFQTTRHRARHPVTGEERRFTVLAVPDWVNVIALTRDRRVVLIRQYRHGAEGVCLEIPGGMVDPGEDHATAAARELQEETGYVAASWQQIGVVNPNPAIQPNRLSTWLALDAHRPGGDHGPRDLDSSEVIDVELASLAEVTAMLRDGRIDHALVVAAFTHLLLREGAALVAPATP
ncbi:MAG: NUDIX hydrolase [Kofleriaceae bacterium]|nr:NUDIX hydrolase [Myxococcales bacterium]MCB9561653.1 NUDIX hydrolase [Kofleriaceae bacterium]MCB9574624.1 NUDIX hydrolase [Kofleriaceae bacterium]